MADATPKTHNAEEPHRAPVSARLTDDARHLLADLAGQLGVSKSAVIEMAIREKAQRMYTDDGWTTTPEYRASIARARKQPGYPVTPGEMAAIAAADASDAEPVIEGIIRKYRDG